MPAVAIDRATTHLGPGWDRPVAVLVTAPGGAEPAAYAVGPPGAIVTIAAPELRVTVAEIEDRWAPRWVVWSAREDLTALVAARVRLHRLWDISQAHLLLHGGGQAHPGLAWAAASGLSADTVPGPPRGDLFEFAADRTDPRDAEDLVRADGHLRPDAVHGTWIERPSRLRDWARAALATAAAQGERADSLSPRLRTTIHAESAAALLCLELERDGLPLDRARIEGLITDAAGPRPHSPADEIAARTARDRDVLRHVPGREGTDLRNPAQVKALLAAVGIEVPTTRKWVLETQRAAHPVVPALLAWRARERIATTYGHRWLAAHVGPDDRLRGQWNACDGAAGRMTADNGLHNLPATLRSGVAAAPGFRFVRADLGQIEPRVLAAVSGDSAFAQATRADDLYAPVADRLGVDRPAAKIAVLAAMYGQRSGVAGEALKGLQRAYPVAMATLDEAYAVGVRGGDVRTFGGRLIPTGRFVRDAPVGADTAADAARGRFARNALIQGAAAELFKAWAVTVRAWTAPLGAEIVLCLHDELLVHAPESAAPEVAALVERALDDAARRWSGGAPFRFVSDTSILTRWSQAKA